MSQPVSTDPRSDPPFAPTIEEVDIEVGFILGCTCCSLELEDDDDLEAFNPVETSEPEPSIPARAD